MNRFNVYWLESRFEILKHFRNKSFILPTLTFPLMFYLFFGVAFGGGRFSGGVNLGLYLIATYGAFGVIGACLFAFGVGVATERGQGWLELKHATPMPFGAYLVAKLVASAVVSALVVVMLFALGGAFGGASYSAATWLTLLVALVLGGIPFALLGLTIGYFAPPTAAPVVMNLIYLPMGFASGLWIPVNLLPKFMQTIAEWLPAYHLGQLALTTIDIPTRQDWQSHVIALAGFSLLFLATAFAAYRRDRVRTYA